MKWKIPNKEALPTKEVLALSDTGEWLIGFFRIEDGILKCINRDDTEELVDVVAYTCLKQVIEDYEWNKTANTISKDKKIIAVKGI